MIDWREKLQAHIEACYKKSEQERLDDTIMQCVEGMNIIQLTPEEEEQALLEIIFLMTERTEHTTIH